MRKATIVAILRNKKFADIARHEEGNDDQRKDRKFSMVTQAGGGSGYGPAAGDGKVMVEMLMSAEADSVCGA